MTVGRANDQTPHEMGHKPVHAIAERLTERGLTVRARDSYDGRPLTVTSTRKAACDVLYSDDCYFTCEYTSRRRRRTSPVDTARIVARMLGADYTSPGQYAHLHRGVTPAGAVGREMRARGLTVILNVLEDDEIFSVVASLAISNPKLRGRGEVHLEDNYWVYWECYGDEIAGGPAELADTVADVLTHTASNTVRGRLAFVYGACRRALTRMHARTGRAGKDNAGAEPGMNSGQGAPTSPVRAVAVAPRRGPVPAGLAGAIGPGLGDASPAAKGEVI
jgi:hypothetical protein